MKLTIGFGSASQEISIDDNLVIDILKANEVEIGLKGVDEIKRSLKNPIGTARLKNIVKPGEKVVIVTSDITRPLPSNIIMPSLLEELHDAGVNKKDIVIVFALGSHRVHTDEEKIRLVGEKIYNEITCIDSDVNDCVRMGVTKAGTPVDIFRTVAEADRRICVGNIEYHYFAGYSGGAKAIMP